MRALINAVYSLQMEVLLDCKGGGGGNLPLEACTTD